MNNELAELIKNSRIKNNLTQRELARKIDVDNATISRIEKGKVKKPSINILMNISKTLDINFFELIRIAQYSDKELWELTGIGNRMYNEIFLIDKFDEREIKEFTVFKDNTVYIDILKILNAYKNNIIDKYKAIQLISACRPIDLGNEIIYITEDEDISIESPFS